MFHSCALSDPISDFFVLGIGDLISRIKEKKEVKKIMKVILYVLLKTILTLTWLFFVTLSTKKLLLLALLIYPWLSTRIETSCMRSK